MYLIKWEKIRFIKHYSSFLLHLLLLCCFLYSILMSAWLSDDSFITLTQIVNFHHGDGLVFNFQERVQAFTHPTWFFVLSLITYLTRDYYTTIIVTSVVASMISIALLLAYAHKYKNLTMAFLIVVMLLFSKAFIDYTTSGLENPLSYLLFSMLIYLLLSIDKFDKLKVSLFSIYLLMALLFLNRMDYALILLPITIVILFSYRWMNLKPVLLAGSIVLTWFIFSLIYFGHFFPNTFYAKLKAGYLLREFFLRGLIYFYVQYDQDPITLAIIALGVLLGLFQNKITRAVSIGLVLYLLYLLKSGGDFMQGRFFSVPALLSTFLIINFFEDEKLSPFYYITIIIIIFLTFRETSPLFVDLTYHSQRFLLGVADERGFYFQRFGFLSPNRQWPIITKFIKDKPPTGSRVVCGGLGESALTNRYRFFYIDKCALSDPLLSQLPAISIPDWRIGHHERKIPTNYYDAVIDDTIELADKNLNTFYQDIKKITRSNIFDKNRLRAIFEINTKDYNINKELYKNPNESLPKRSQEFYKYFNKPVNIVVNIEDISSDLSPGKVWNGNGNYIFNTGGISLVSKKPIKANTIKFGLDHNDEYLIILFKDDKYLAFKYIDIMPIEEGGLSTREIKFTSKVVFDKINIFPLNGDGYFSIGYLKCSL